MEHVYLTTEEVNKAYDMKCITTAERDELLRRIKADHSISRKIKRRKDSI